MPKKKKAKVKRHWKRFSDLERKKIFVAYFYEGLSPVAIMARQGRGGAQNTTVHEWINQFRKCHSWTVQDWTDYKRDLSGEAPLPSNSTITPEYLAALKRMIDDDPELYLDEMEKLMLDKHGFETSQTTVHKAIHLPVAKGGLGYSLQVHPSCGAPVLHCPLGTSACAEMVLWGMGGGSVRRASLVCRVLVLSLSLITLLFSVAGSAALRGSAVVPRAAQVPAAHSLGVVPHLSDPLPRRVPQVTFGCSTAARMGAGWSGESPHEDGLLR
jgi:hypothetical protein